MFKTSYALVNKIETLRLIIEYYSNHKVDGYGAPITLTSAPSHAIDVIAVNIN
jgi:hypothetical protein